jgi:large subunit ribosomal protein L12
MEYVYAAMLLHATKQPIDEAHVTKVIDAAGVKADAAKVKALVASLEGVNIEEAIKEAAMPVAVAAAPAAGHAEGKKEEKKKDHDDEAKSEAAAAEGLGALFG